MTERLNDDYAGSMETLGRVWIGEAAYGEIEVGDDADWFAVDLDAGHEYRFDLEGDSTGQGSLIDPLLYLRNGNGEVIDMDDDGGEGYNSSIVFTPDEDGTYYLDAQSWGDHTGSYALFASLVTGEDDYADGPETDGRIDTDAPVTGTIEIGDDADWFSIDLQAGTEYVFNLEGLSTDRGTLIDPVLYLRNADGEVIDMDDDGGEELNSRIIFTPDEDGTYYLSAESWGDHVGTYTLSASVEDSVDAGQGEETADGPDAATWIDGNASVTDEIETGDDADWFAIDLQAGTEYVFDLEGSETGQGSLIDPVLYLHDADGGVIDMDDDGGEGYNSRIVFTPDEDGTYYLSAESWGDHVGTYTLSVSMEEFAGEGPGNDGDDHADGPDTSDVIQIGSAGYGEIETGDDADWFAIDLEAGTEYVFDLEGSETGQGTLVDPILYLRDAGGEVVDMDDDGGEGLNSRIVFTPDEDGTYYLSAESWGDHVGTYTLSVSMEEFAGDDHADGPDTSDVIQIGSAGYGEIETGDDADWFAIDLEAGNEYVFDLEGDETGQGTLVDPILYLRDAGGEVVDMDDDGGEGLNSRIVFTPDEDGTYYLDAQSWGDHTGSYALFASLVTDGDDHPDGPETGSWLDMDGRVTGTIESGNDADWFGVWMEAGHQYQFDLEGDSTGQGSLIDPMLFLMDENGDMITMDDDGGEGLNSRIVFAPEQDGIYYLSAESWGEHTGSYVLSATDTSDVWA